MPLTRTDENGKPLNTCNNILIDSAGDAVELDDCVFTCDDIDPNKLEVVAGKLTIKDSYVASQITAYFESLPNC